VFACYVSHHGHAFIDRELYLPKEWTDDADRLKAAHVPDEVSFATKPQIARQMIARALAAKVPFAFVVADILFDHHFMAMLASITNVVTIRHVPRQGGHSHFLIATPTGMSP
jgi:DDE superfamily endonuclease